MLIQKEGTTKIKGKLRSYQIKEKKLVIITNSKLNEIKLF